METCSKTYGKGWMRGVNQFLQILPLKIPNKTWSGKCEGLQGHLSFMAQRRAVTVFAVGRFWSS